MTRCVCSSDLPMYFATCRVAIDSLGFVSIPEGSHAWSCPGRIVAVSLDWRGGSVRGASKGWTLTDGMELSPIGAS